MHYQLILGFARNSQSMASFPKASVASGRVLVKDEETVQQVPGENAAENKNLDIKKEALKEHAVF